MEQYDSHHKSIGFQIRSTADILKEIITIIMALAFTQAIGSFLTTDTGAPIQLTWERIFAFLCIITAIVRFFHGNVSYLTRTYNLPDHEARARKYNFMLAVDFLFIFLQSILFCALAWYQRHTLEFYVLFTFLFFIDALWFFVIIAFSKITFKDFEAHQAQEHVRALMNWMVVNTVSGIIMLVLILPKAARTDANLDLYVPYFFIIIMANTVIDYVLNRRLYFPLGAKHSKRISVFVAARFTTALQTDQFDSNLRRTIETVHEVIKGRDFDLYSAHIAEQFGKQLSQPEDFVRRDISQISSCDVFIAILDGKQSVGMSIELGWASFLGKTILLLLLNSFESSKAPILSGLRAITHCKIVWYTDLSDLRSKLSDALDAYSKK